MALFSGRHDDRQKSSKRPNTHFDKEASLEEELSDLVAREKPRSVTRAISEADEAVHEAAREEITRMKLIEQGCCPECRGRIENFLYTQVCPSCGWFRRMVPDSGRCIVHMDTGEKILCDRVFQVNDDQFLCVTGGVVRSHVMQKYIKRVEYVWEDAELKEAQKSITKQRHGICSWCDKDLHEAEQEEPIEEYVALGSAQARYVFCSIKCLESFRKQYPSRVHRNCYETDCNTCDKCIKRYDSSGFKRVMLTK